MLLGLRDLLIVVSVVAALITVALVAELRKGSVPDDERKASNPFLVFFTVLVTLFSGLALTALFLGAIGLVCWLICQALRHL
jgi:hypothetical protein